MCKLWIYFLLWSSACVNVLAQAPPLDTFESPDAVFRFVYPQSYDLLVGERILKGTQGKNSQISVCDFATAIACVIYPFDRLEQSKLEAGDFAVSRVPAVTNERECLAFADRPSLSDAGAMRSVTINHVEFHTLSSRSSTLGHTDVADYYRIFRRQNCYELKIEVLLLDAPVKKRAAKSNSIGDEMADSARESLGLILSSFTFE